MEPYSPIEPYSAVEPDSAIDVGTPIHKRRPHSHDKIQPYPAHPGPREPKKYHEEHSKISSRYFQEQDIRDARSSGSGEATVVGKSDGGEGHE